MADTELENLKKQVQLLASQISIITKENNDLKRLINGHAVIINKNTADVKKLDRDFRSEIGRIAAAFKRIQTKLSGGGPG